ncbi:MAG: hypothetical protein U0Y10_05510 [Spirosomataceae bacterium]
MILKDLKSIPLRYVTALLVVMSMAACHPEKTAQLGKTIDLEKWRSDRGGCHEFRTTQMTTLKAAEGLIKGLTQNEVAEALGKPDRQQLADRNQKFFVYFLEKGPHCDDIKQVSEARSVAFRFSALGLVTEITYQNGMPR